MDLLHQYIVKDKCRLVTLLGMGGIGKTALSVKSAQTIASQFEFVIWRSLRQAISLDKILADLIQFLSDRQRLDLPDSNWAKIALLIKLLRSSRCLIILDNAESILQSGSDSFNTSLVTKYRSDYQDYGDLFKAIAQTNHQSCLLVTSREQLPNFAAFEGDNLAVRCLRKLLVIYCALPLVPMAK